MTDWLVPGVQFLQRFAQNNPHVYPYFQLLGLKVVFFVILLFLYAAGTALFRPPQRPLFNINWGLWSVSEVFVIVILFQVISSYLKNPMVARHNLEGAVTLWTTVEYLFLFMILWYTLRIVLNRNLADVGWHVGILKEDFMALLRGVLFVSVVAVLVNFVYWTEILPATSKIIREVTLRTVFSNGFFSVVQVILVLLFSPVVEEVFYRGFIYPVLRNRLPRSYSIILVSLFFASMHFQWNWFLLLFLMSCAASAAYDRTQRLAAPIIIHSFYNILVLWGYFNY